MTYDYAQQTAILGSLSMQASPGAYDLCKRHAQRLTAPRGWEVVRLADSFTPPPANDAELMALANAVIAAGANDAPRHSTRPSEQSGPVDRQKPSESPTVPGQRHGHLTLVDDPKKVS